MIKNITIRTRLIGIIAFLLVVAVLIGAGGLIALASVNASLKTVYEDRLIAMGQLDRVVRMANRHQLMLAKALTADPSTIPALLASLEKDIIDGEKQWSAYSATSLTEKEKELAADFAAKRASFMDEAIRPAMAAVRANDLATASKLVHGAIDATYAKARVPLNALIELQLEVGEHEYKEAQLHYQEFRTMTIIALVLAVLLGGAVGFWLIRSIAGPLDVAIGVARRIASGDLSHRIDVDSTNEMGRLLTALKEMSASLTTTVSDVRTSTDTIATASSEIAAGNLDLSSRTEQQAASLEETASSMEELTSTVKQNADNARSANALVMTASGYAQDGGAAVSKVVATMGDIKESSRKISDIIGVIDSIAFQTNILALNAAVEAARAGEQGRGFAVVATEVRNLAQRSAAAAKEIKVLINDSTEKVDTGGRLVDEAGLTIGRVVSSVKQVSDIMGEIAAASEEQSAGIDQINQAVAQMDEVTQQNAALVEESAAAAASLQEQANGLERAVSVFILAGGQSFAAAPRKATPSPQPLKRPALKPVRAITPPVRASMAPVAATAGGDWEAF